MKLKILIGFTILIFAVSCQQIEDSCKEEKDGSAIVYDFPDSLLMGQQQDVKVAYIIENSCGSFVEFEDTVVGNTTSVKVKLLYDGCNCELQFEEDSSYYSIKQDSAGIYSYKFFLGDGDYDIYNVVVHP